MRQIILMLLSVFLIAAIGCSDSSGYNYYGVPIPDFNNPQIDSLVHEQERYRSEYLSKLENGEEIPFGLASKAMGSDYHTRIMEINYADGDDEDLNKYGKYNRANADKLKKFMEKINKKKE